MCLLINYNFKSVAKNEETEDSHYHGKKIDTWLLYSEGKYTLNYNNVM